jgi:hypothetical protein
MTKPFKRVLKLENTEKQRGFSMAGTLFKRYVVTGTADLRDFSIMKLQEQVTREYGFIAKNRDIPITLEICGNEITWEAFLTYEIMDA